MATLTGKTLGNYLILEEVGRGAMGVVFKARQLSMDRIVALKFLPTRLAQNEKVVQRFLREAKAAGQLAHPHVVGVHDAGQVEGLYFIAMEYVDGNSVHSHVRKNGPYSEKETLDICGQIAEALKMAHGRGILHRDIKPDNFLIDTHGRARLADLGLARFESGDGSNEAELTQNGTALGTPHYMAPEQCKGEKLDGRADLYSLGVSMYVMSTGQTPFDGPTGPAVMVKVLTEAPRPIKQWNAKLTPGFMAFVEKVMHKDASRRFQDAASLLHAIEEVKAGTYKHATSGHAKISRSTLTSTDGTPASPPSKLRLIMFGAGAAILALVILGITSKKDTDKKTAEVKVAPAPIVDKPVIVEPKPVVVAPVDKPVALPPVIPEPDAPDTKPEMVAAMQAWRAFKADNQPILQKNPRAVIERLEAFLKQHSAPRPKLAALAMLNEARDAQNKLEARWTTTQEYVKTQMAAGHRAKAFFALLEFSEAHTGSAEAAQAKTQLGAMIETVRRDAAAVAEAGEYDKAQEMLAAAINKMPDSVTAALKTDMEQYKAASAQQKAIADADAKRLATLLDTACAQCREPDVVSGKRYDFAIAARTLKEGIDGMKTAAAKKDLEGLATTFARAADTFTRMRGKTAELQSLGRYGTGQLVAWEDRGLSYKPAGLPQAQTVPWKSITGENLVQIAQATKTIPGQSANDLFNLGALAFAAGANTLAGEKFEEAAKLDGKVKLMTDAPLRVLKPGASTDPEILARDAYTSAVAAQTKRDGVELLKLIQHIMREYPNTQFVKTHLKEIQELRVPPQSEEPAVAAVAEKPKEIAEKPAEKKDDPAAIGAAELKKAGWQEIKGNWLPDPKTKGLYQVAGGGQLTAATLDGQLRLRFLLEEGASIGIYVRHPQENEIQKALRRQLENNALISGPGYGVEVAGGVATYYGDKNVGASVAPAVRQMVDKIPLKIGGGPIASGAIHSVVIAVKGDNLEVLVNDRSVTRSSTPLRNEGDITIIIDGNAKVLSPTVSK